MVISKIQQELIDKFLRDELKEDGLQHFKLELSKDPVFKKEFIFQKSLKKAAKIENVRELINKAKANNSLRSKQDDLRFKEVQNSIEKAKLKNINKGRIRNIRRWLMVAASIFLVGMVALMNYNRNDVNQELLAHFEEIKFSDQSKVEEIQQVSGSAEVIQLKLDRLQQANTDKNFDIALTIIQDLKKPQYDYNPDLLLYYEATINAQALEYEKSLESLTTLITQNSKLADEAKWLRSLIYLNTGKNGKAKSDLENLSLSSAMYKSKAQKILNKYF